MHSEYKVDESTNPILAEVVKGQLRQILEHPLFAHSKRYPAFLRYVVEQTICGHADQIKERTIGVLVFGKDPTYDANADPIVRVTAAEVRKRLLQYYEKTEQTDNLRIVLSIGSYIPEFRVGSSFTSPHSSNSLPIERQRQDLKQDSGPPLKPSPEGIVKHRPISSRYQLIAATACILMAILCSEFFLFHNSTKAKGSLLQQFWSAPSSQVSLPLLICLPDISGKMMGASANFDSPEQPVALTFADHLMKRDVVIFGDVIAATKVIRAIDIAGRSLQVRLDSETNLDDLRAQPSVLIGAGDNIWTTRSLQQLPFRLKLDRTNKIASIIDTKDAGRPSPWNFSFDTAYRTITRDYGIVARFSDPTTGQETTIVAGIGDNGTEAAAELLSTEAGVASLANWINANPAKVNFEAVLGTEVVSGKSGPPVILAAKVW